MSLLAARQSHLYESFHLQSSCEKSGLYPNRTRVKDVVGSKLEIGRAHNVFAK